MQKRMHDLQISKHDCATCKCALVCVLRYIPYTFEGENFREFYGFVVKVFSAKFGGSVSFGTTKTSNLRKFSP